MNSKIKGKVLKYGDDVNTDEIIPLRFHPETFTGLEAEKTAREHTLADLDPDFSKKVQKGDILAVGKNFGCGSSRENAATMLRDSGISLILAESFANVFYRNAINNCLPVITASHSVLSSINEEDEIEVDINTGEIQNTTIGKNLKGKPIPEYFMQILKAGGIIPYTKEKYGF